MIQNAEHELGMLYIVSCQFCGAVVYVRDGRNGLYSASKRQREHSLAAHPDDLFDSQFFQGHYDWRDYNQHEELT